MTKKQSIHKKMTITLTLTDADFDALQKTLDLADSAIAHEENYKGDNGEAAEMAKPMRRDWRRANRVVYRMVYPMASGDNA